MKALSIRQPWAWAIAAGHKTVENRSWTTNFRGEFLIHASQTFETWGVPYIQSILGEKNIKFPVDQSHHKGIIGKATIVNCVHEYDKQLLSERDQRWFIGTYGFLTENPMMFADPIPCKGQLGFFTPPPEVLNQLRERGLI